MNNPYGKGSHDTSSKHGTNVNYKNSGMKDHLGNAVDMNKGGGAPFLKGLGAKLLDPLNLKDKIGGLFGKKKAAAEPAAAGAAAGAAGAEGAEAAVDPNAAPDAAAGMEAAPPAEDPNAVKPV